MQSRIKAMLGCGLVVMILGSLFALYGYDATWKLWNIPTMSPHFADLRTITGGAASYAQGLDPMVANPGDPWERTLNYPRVWQSLYSMGVNQSHTTYIGIVLVALFMAGICLILPNANWAMILLVMTAVLSPATLLGVERGNIDLLMFFLAAFSAATVKRWRLVSAGTILLGFVLKLYPIFACAVLFRSNKAAFSRYALTIFAFSILYIGITYSDLMLIKEATQKEQDIGMSYGLNVLWMNLAELNISMGGYAIFLSYLAVFLSLWCAYAALLRKDFVQETPCPSVYLDAFRAGASIYLGTFLLGINFGYRLMFLILVIPQLLVWTKSTARHIAASSSVILLPIFISLWSLMIIKISDGLPYGAYISFALDEISHWLIFAGLLYLFFWSMPEWVKEYAHKIHA